MTRFFTGRRCQDRSTGERLPGLGDGGAWGFATDRSLSSPSKGRPQDSDCMMNLINLPRIGCTCNLPIVGLRYTQVYIKIYTYIYIYTYVYIYMNIICLCTYTNIYIYIYTYMYISIYICTYHMYICVLSLSYIYMCILRVY